MTDPTTITLLPYTLLFAAGLAGGCIDAIAGGGGLITVPALLAVGLPPHLALGTNKLQSACGTAIALWRYAKAGMAATPCLWLAVVVAAVASFGGAYAVCVMDRELLRQIIPWLLVAVAIYTACNRSFGIHPGKSRMSFAAFAVLLGLALGFYDGFFGPGTGSFWILALVVLLGLDLRNATGYAKATNLASNLGSLAVFLTTGSVHLMAAGVMIVGQIVGARLGSGLVIRNGTRLIRPVFLAVVFAMTLKLLWDVWWHQYP